MMLMALVVMALSAGESAGEVLAATVLMVRVLAARASGGSAGGDSVARQSGSAAATGLPAQCRRRPSTLRRGGCPRLPRHATAARRGAACVARDSYSDTLNFMATVGGMGFGCLASFHFLST